MNTRANATDTGRARRLCRVFACAAIMAAFMFCLPAAGTARVASAYTNNSASLTKLYAQPREDAQVVAEYVPGVPIYVISGAGGDWYSVSVSSMVGYMREDCLYWPGADEDDALRLRPPAMRVVTDSEASAAGLHPYPDANSGVITDYPPGAEVTVWGVAGEWYHVDAGNAVGFMHSDYLDGSLDSYAGEDNNSNEAAAGTDLGHAVSPPIIFRPGYMVALYASPDANSLMTAKYYTGAQIVVNEYASKEWLNVSVGSITGYVSVDGIRDYWGAGQSQYALPTALIKSSGSKVNLRAMPYRSAPVVSSYPRETQVEVLGYASGWAHVRIGETMGFMDTDYLTGIDIPPVWKD